MIKTVRIPLKFKLIILLVGLSTFVLMSFAFVAISDFTQDKMAYVFDANKAHSSNSANQMRTEIQFTVNKLTFLMRGFDSNTFKLHSFSKSIFSNEGQLDALFVYKNPKGEQFKIAHKAINSNFNKELYRSKAEKIKKLLKKAKKNQISLDRLSPHSSTWALALRYDLVGTKKKAYVLGVFNQGDFLDIFSSLSRQKSFLLDRQNKILMQPKEPSFSNINKEELYKVLQQVSSQMQGSSLARQVTLENTNESLLVSASSVDIAGLNIVSYVPRSTALEPLRALKFKGLIIFLILVLITIVISVLSSNKLTFALNQLTQGTKKISKGQFDVSVSSQSNDEIGELSANFNIMAKEIGRLVVDTEAKIRMENELKMAHLVQNTLFPEPSYQSENVAIEGFYEPASECGGDWWFHNKIDGKYYFWIGDATGHGAPAALVTAAARSTASLIENMKGGLAIDHIMYLLNQSIYSCAKGQVLMTFFLASYDPTTRILSYCNASHEPPFVLPFTESKLTKRDLIPLLDHTFPRLGESGETNFRLSEYTLNPKDRVIFYTDGVTELKNPENKMLGERLFLKNILHSINEKKSLKDSVLSLEATINDFRQSTPLDDDLTYFMVQV